MRLPSIRCARRTCRSVSYDFISCRIPNASSSSPRLRSLKRNLALSQRGLSFFRQAVGMIAYAEKCGDFDNSSAHRRIPHRTRLPTSLRLSAGMARQEFARVAVFDFSQEHAILATHALFVPAITDTFEEKQCTFAGGTFFVFTQTISAS